MLVGIFFYQIGTRGNKLYSLTKIINLVKISILLTTLLFIKNAASL